jgi:penicillin-binding protein 1C
LTLAIGGVEASPRDLATAYAGLARGGGRLMTRLATAPPPSDPTPAILPATACWQTLHCLDDAGRTAVVCPEAARLRPAWKTGTSSGHRDAWCAAVTPRFTVVVWLGTMAGKGSPVLVGQETAAPLALSLLATIDPGGPTWPEIASAPPATVRPPASAPPLVIVTPADRTDIVTDPDVPRERQRLALESRGGSAGRRWWFHDGEPIGESASGQPLWWDPPTGRHQLRVADAVGHAATATVTVR